MTKKASKNKNNYVITYPENIGLRGLISVPSSLKGKKREKFVQSRIGVGFYTYSESKDGLDLIVFDEGYVAITNELPFHEYCRTHYAFNAFSDYKIYINFEHSALVAISDGLIKSYAKCGSENEVSDFAKNIEKAAFSEGLKATFLFDKYIEIFEGKRFFLDDKSVFNAVKPEQVLRKTNFMEMNKEAFLSSLSHNLSFKSIATPLIMVSAICIATVTINQTMEASIKKSELAISEQLNVLKTEFEGNNKIFSESKTTAEESIKKLNSLIASLESELNQIKTNTQAIQAKMELSVVRHEGGLDSGAKSKELNLPSLNDMIKADDVDAFLNQNLMQELGYFMCKPLMVSDEEVLCLYRNTKMNITKKPQKITGFYASYLPKEKAFLTVLNGQSKKTPLSIAERGFE
ncbi:hypothetical protein [Thiomicrorhabdus aquaedulcis]|uniref:hypothetical protein n=1 Tax=Thiomicrorhabdus aquaedulcis TaxID=2211106 RepID=UPI000FDB187F|nr:hypothetical protein [Thiomicrorhabdus aquaedulcis]